MYFKPIFGNLNILIDLSYLSWSFQSSTGSQGSQHLQHQQKFRAPVVAPEECDGPEEAGTRVGDSNSQDDVTYTIRAGNDSDVRFVHC